MLFSPVPGEPGKLLFWGGDSPVWPVQLDRELGAFVRWVGAMSQAEAEGWLCENTRPLTRVSLFCWHLGWLGCSPRNTERALPEGDTIHKVAAIIAPDLVGRILAGVRLTPYPDIRLAGRRVTNVHALGKHLFIGFADGLLLRSHLGMYGSWHRYRPGEPWRKPERSASVVLDTGDWLLVCFNASAVELLQVGGFGARDWSRHANLERGRRRTRFVDDGRGDLWVYKRDGRPCLACGTRISSRPMGRHLRPTFWRPVCQETL